MVRILSLFLLLVLPELSLALQKSTYSESDESLYTEFRARSSKSKGFSTACYSEGVLLATNKTSLTAGTRILLFSDSADVNKTIKRFRNRLKKARGAAKKRFRQRIKSLRSGLNRCSEGSGGENGGGSTSFRHPGPGTSAIGTNVDWNDYFTPEIKFCDLFKQSREFVPVTNDVFDSGTLTLRSDGYPTFLPQGNTIATTLLGFGAQGTEMPAGTYTFSFEGSGQIVMSGDGLTDGERSYETAGTFSVRYQPNSGGIWFNVVRSEQSDPIRNIRFIIPGYEDTCDSDPFYEPFITFLQNFSVVRVMNMMQVNNTEYPCDGGQAVTSTSCVRSWGTRTLTTSQTQGGGRGVALEHIVGLANEANVDIWINMPHATSEEYIQNAAELVCGSLESNLRVYIEYSNEVWNQSDEFPQSDWAANMESSLGLRQSGDPVLGQRYYVNRVIRMYELFEAACGARRVVNVLGGWSGSSSMNQLNLADFSDSSVNPNNVQPEGLAIAYYSGIWLVDYLERTGQASTATVSQMLSLMEQNITGDVVVDDGTEESMVSAVTSNLPHATNAGIPLIAYESGQHVVSQSFENSDQIGPTVVALNRDSGMYDLYISMYRSWFNNGGSLAMHFSGVGEFTGESGAFGVKESFDQSLSSAHKFRAILDMQSELSSD